MPRKNKYGIFVSTKEQRDAMKRRIAEHFHRHDGAILVKTGPAWRSDLIGQLTRELRPLKGVRQRRAHAALVSEVVKKLCDKTLITNGGGVVQMSAKYMAYQVNIGRHLRQGRQSVTVVKDRCHGQRGLRRKDPVPVAA